MKHYDVSFHFTTKGQNAEEIFKKIDKWLLEHPDVVDFSERSEGEPNTVLHHCFARREDCAAKGFDTTVCDELDTYSEDQICWNGVSQYSVDEDRMLMLQNLKRLNGIAIFVGKIEGSVKDELGFAKNIGVKTIIID